MSRKKSTLLDIAELRHRITFQRVTQVSDGMGGFTTAWNDIVTLWAKVEPVSASERLYSERLETQRSHKVKIRFRNDITTDMRFVFKGRTFQVKGVYSPDERRAYTFIDAEENQGT
jgi:SPP1 family predicted phage head-tail adaptor